MNPARLREFGGRPYRVLAEVFTVGASGTVVLTARHDFSVPVLTAVVGCALLLWRHRWPRLVLVLCLPALVGGLGWPPTVVALFAVGRARPYLRRLMLWALVVAAVALAPVLLVQPLTLAESVLTVTFVLFMVTIPTALGALVATRQRLRDSLARTHAAVEAESVAKAETARAEERSRIAREIHDAVGHDVTLIAVESAALGATSSDPEVREKARRIRGLASEALNEMRTTLGLGGSESRADSLGTIPELVARVREIGHDAELVDDLGEAVDLGAGVGRAAYRIVQEALTNVSKHAPGAAVTVHLGTRGDALCVTVDNGPPAAPPVNVAAGGRGLAGLSERAEMAGGTLEAGPSEDGGYRLSAILPRENG